jgi:peptide/nickel transport system permease protein
MLRWLLARLLWLVAMLLGITFVTFVVIDQAPVDRAELRIGDPATERSFVDPAARAAAIRQLRIRYGMFDPVTNEPAPLADRYVAWLGNAARFRFAGPHDDDAALRARLAGALPVTAWLGGLALLVAFAIGIPVGVWLGQRVGSRAERTASVGMLLGASLPEFLLATLLLLAFSSAWLQWLPASGLHTPGSEQWSFAARLVDHARHLLLPVAVTALAPTVLVARFVRDAVARAARAPFVAALHALGQPAAIVRARLRRHGLTPVATLVGSLLPMVVGGSIVVENLFALDGLGHLAFTATMQLDQPLLMALVVLGSLVTLAGFVLSDALHRLVDPRVRWR